MCNMQRDRIQGIYQYPKQVSVGFGKSTAISDLMKAIPAIDNEMDNRCQEYRQLSELQKQLEADTGSGMGSGKGKKFVKKKKKGVSREEKGRVRGDRI